jgi:hypothetical protein
MAGWKSYQNLAQGFAMSYPSSWTTEEDPSGSVVIFTSSTKGDNEDLTEPAVNIITQNVGDQTLEQFTAKTLEQLTKMSVPKDELKVDNAVLAGEKAMKCMYTATMEDVAAVQFYQIWTIKNKTAFIITFSCAQEVFDQHLKLLTQMLQSFRFIKAKRRMRNILLKTYVQKKDGFVIKVPVSWKPASEKDATAGGYVASWSFASQSEEFVVTLGVSINSLPQPNMTLTEYLEVVFLQLEKSLPLGMKIFVKDTKLDNVNAKQIRYQSDAFNKGERFAQVFAVKNDKVYTLTCRTMMKEYDHRPFGIFNRIIASFKFLNEGETLSEDPSLLTLENLIHNFSLQHDSYFTPKEDFLGMTLALVKTTEVPKLQSQMLAAPTHIAVVIRDVRDESDVSLAKLTQELKEQTLQLAHEAGGSKVKITRDEDATIDSCPGHLLVFEGPGPNGGSTTILQKYTIKDQMAVLITFTANTAQWQKELAAAQKVIDSFRFL